MKKAVAILISLALLIGICNFAVYAVNQYSDKIYQYNTILSDSSDSDLIDAYIYYDILAHSTDELDQIVYERCGYTTTNNYGFDVPVFYLSQEDKKKWREADKVYKDTMNQLRLELGYEAAKPVLDYVGINLVFNGKNYFYHDEQVTSLGEKGMRLYLSKAEILKAAEMDYVIKIVCYDPNWTPENDYTDPSGTMPPVTQNSTVEPTNEDLPQPVDGNYAKEFVNWSVSKYGENCLSDGYSYKELYTHYNGGEPDWVLVEAHFFHPEPDLETYVHIGGAGGRTIFGPTIGSPFLTGYGVYDVKAGEFYGFEQFADNDCSFFTVVNKLPFDCTKYDGLLDALANLNIGEITGDANNDKSMDILDATQIQKASSEKIKLDKDSEALGDVNSDYKTDVLDASIIQKSLVAE